VVVLALLALLTHSVAPGPARAYWTPPDIAKSGGPSDPGTPYEEPEGGGGSGTDPGGTEKPPEGIVGQGGVVVSSPSTPGAPRTLLSRPWLLLALQSWRINILYLSKF